MSNLSLLLFLCLCVSFERGVKAFCTVGIVKRDVCVTITTERHASPLSLDNSLTTAVAFYLTRDEDQQQSLIGSMKKIALPMLRECNGFVSIHLHQSLDGNKVATYEQWDTLDNYQEASSLESFRTAIHRAIKGAAIDPTDQNRKVYEIFRSESNLVDEDVSVNPKYSLVHFAEFYMDPSKQPAMVQLAHDNIGPAMETEGLLSATFHKSMDGTMVLNYGQWTDVQAIERLKQQPGFGTGTPYWEGVARNEHHLYKLVSSCEVE